MSTADIYHVYIRGVGRHLLFEDDADRRFFVDTLCRYLPKEGRCLAWVLMTNHVHLLVELCLDKVSNLMKLVEVTYAQHFNSRYSRVGHLFQGRYGSRAIQSDEQLLATVRYIHLNPVEAGLSQTFEYPWSSYGQYLGGPTAQGLCDTALVLDMIGGTNEFRRFHEASSDDHSPLEHPFDAPRTRTTHLPDESAVLAAENALGPSWRSRLATSDKDSRNADLHTLKEAGLSIRQIERLTGIGRSIVARA